jgi:hypothetical protein
MARVALTVNFLTPNAGVVDFTGTAITTGTGNGFQIAAVSVPHPNVFLRVANASGSTANVKVLAGSQPSAQSSGLGNVTATVLTATTQWVGPFDTSRVQQPDGSLLIESDQIVTVTAFALDGRRN